MNTQVRLTHTLVAVTMTWVAMMAVIAAMQPVMPLRVALALFMGWHALVLGWQLNKCWQATKDLERATKDVEGELGRLAEQEPEPEAEGEAVICAICSKMIEDGKSTTIHHQGKALEVCNDCEHRPLCDANPDGTHGEVVVQQDPEFDPELMLIGPLPPDRVFGYCQSCLQSWEWRGESQEWEPLTWERLAYLWAERSSGAFDASEEIESVDVYVSYVETGDGNFYTVNDRPPEVLIVLSELVYVLHEDSGKMIRSGGNRPGSDTYNKPRAWHLQATPPFDLASEVMQIARAAGFKEGDAFSIDDLLGQPLRIEVNGVGSIVRIVGPAD